MEMGISAAVARNEKMKRGTRTIQSNGSVVCADKLNEYKVGATFAVTENARTTRRKRENPSPAGNNMMWNKPARPASLYAVDQAALVPSAVANAAPRICTRTYKADE